MAAWLRFLIAFAVGCHGFTYVMYGYMIDGKIKAIKEWKGTSWILGSTIQTERLKKITFGLHVAAGILVMLCALAIALNPLAPGWWRPFAIGGAIVGIVGFVIYWDGQTKFLVEEGLIGASISLCLLVAAIVFAGAFN